MSSSQQESVNLNETAIAGVNYSNLTRLIGVGNWCSLLDVVMYSGPNISPHGLGRESIHPYIELRLLFIQL